MKVPKKFDSVANMREIREMLSLKYWNHSELLLKEMKTIQIKYSKRIGSKKVENKH